MKLESDHTYNNHLEDRRYCIKIFYYSKWRRCYSFDINCCNYCWNVTIFRYLSFNKRFGIVKSTITASTGDLLPVLIIFESIVISYAILTS